MTEFSLKLSLSGFLSSLQSLLNEAIEVLRENDENIYNSDFKEINHALEMGRDANLTFYEVSIALLRGDISKEEALKFFCFDDKFLAEYKYRNNLIIFTPKSNDTENN